MVVGHMCACSETRRTRTADLSNEDERMPGAMLFCVDCIGFDMQVASLIPDGVCEGMVLRDVTVLFSFLNFI